MMMSLLRLVGLAALVVGQGQERMPASAVEQTYPCLDTCEEELKGPISIDHVTVLLPTTAKADHASGLVTGVTKFKLRAHGSCFEWIADSDSVVEVDYVPDECCPNGGSRAVILTPTLPTNQFTGRQSTWLEAHSGRGTVSRCEVFVDRISRLEMLTNTRRVNVGEYESLQLQAYDNQNNYFTTLEGMRFEWFNTAENILRTATFTEANMNVTQLQTRMEHESLGTDILPVRGRHLGKARVIARLSDPHNPVEVTVTLTVTEPLKLTPSSSHVMIGTQLSHTLWTGDREKGGQWEKITMPSAQYSWTCSDETVTSIDPRLGVVHALRLGLSRVVAQDVNFNEHQQTADVHVVEPLRLELRLHPAHTHIHPKKAYKRPTDIDGAWLIDTNSAYTLELLVISASERVVMTVTKNTPFHVKFEGDSIRRKDNLEETEFAVSVEEPSLSCPLKLHTLRQGVTAITAQLHVIDVQTGQDLPGLDYSFLHASAKIRVTSSLQASVTELRFPSSCSPSAGPPSFHLAITGGSGRNLYQAYQKNVVRIDEKGRVYALGKGVGRVTITDEYNEENLLQIPVFVSEAAELLMLPGIKEIQVDSVADIAFGVRDSDGFAFSNCSCLGLAAVLTEGASSFHVLTPEGEHGVSQCEAACPLDNGRVSNESCWLLSVKAIQEGFTQVEATIIRDLQGSSAPKQHRQATRAVSTGDGANDASSLTVSNNTSSSPYTSSDDVDTTNSPVITFPFPRSSMTPYACDVLSAYLPVEANVTDLVLAVGSSLTVGWQNGPLPWPVDGFSCHSGRMNVTERSAKTRRHLHQVNETALATHVTSYGPFSWVQYEKSGRLPPRPPRTGRMAMVLVTPSAFSDHLRLFRVTCLDLSSVAQTTSEEQQSEREDAAAAALEIKTANQAVFSNPFPATARSVLKVQCFPRISVEPTTLVLGVGATRQLTVQGHHPLQRNVTFSSYDPQIAMVNKMTGIVTGHNLGQTIVRAMVARPGLGNLTLSPEEDGLQSLVHVLVRFEAFRIVLGSDTLLEGETTHASLEGANGEVPSDLSFESVDCQWTSPDTYLFALLSAHTTQTARDVPVCGPSVGVTAQRAGRAVISVTCRVQAPALGSKVEVYSMRTSLLIMEPLKLLSPSFLLLPFGARSQISTTWDDHADRNLKFEVLFSSTDKREYVHEFLRVDKVSGLVQISPFPVQQPQKGKKEPQGNYIVLVQTTDEDEEEGEEGGGGGGGEAVGRQSQAVRVEVRAVHQLSVAPVYGSPLYGPLCSGRNLSLQVFLKDSLGRPFSSLEGWGSPAGGPGLAFRTHRPDLLRVHKLEDSSMAALSRKQSLESDAGGSGEEDGYVANQGVLAHLSLTATGSPINDAVVLQVWLPQQSDIASVYVKVQVADQMHCVPPSFARVTLQVLGKQQEELAQVPFAKRASWEQSILHEISSALEITPHRLKLVAVDAGSGYFVIDLFPQAMISVLPSQWQYLLYNNTGGNGGIGARIKSDDEVNTLVALLKEQLHDSSSMLLRGRIARGLNKTFIDIVSMPIGPALARTDTAAWVGDVSSDFFDEREMARQEAVRSLIGGRGQTSRGYTIIATRDANFRPELLTEGLVAAAGGKDGQSQQSVGLGAYLKLFLQVFIGAVVTLLAGLLAMHSIQGSPALLPGAQRPAQVEGPGRHQEQDAEQNFYRIQPQPQYWQDD